MAAPARPQGRSSLTRNLWRRLIGTSVSTAAGYAMGGAIQPVLEPLTQSLANTLWAKHPSKPLSAGVAARAAALGIWTPDKGKAEAASTGIGADRFEALRQLEANYPTLGQAIELRNRGLIDDAGYQELTTRIGYPAKWRGLLEQLRTYLVPPSDAVRFAVREVYNPSQRAFLDLDAEYPSAFTDAVAPLGITEETARQYWASHWNLPSFEQLNEMLFRGELSPDEYRDALKAIDYAPTWRGKLEAIARRIPTMTDFTRLVVREVYNPAQRAALKLDADYPETFTAKAALHGMSEQDARDLWAGHWDLPSPTQGYRMLWRGLIGKAELDGLLKALDYSPAWRDHLRDIAYLVPGRIDLRRMYAGGIINRQQVLEGYKHLGYNDDNAETLTRFTVQLANGGTAARAATVAELRDEREGGYITAAEYRAALELLGYEGTALETELHLADARRSKRWRDKAVDAIGKAFIAGKQDEAGARALLAQAGVTGEAADLLFPWWRIIDAATEKQLTAAQVRAAYRKNNLTREQAVERLELLDYTTTDAGIYLDS